MGSFHLAKKKSVVAAIVLFDELFSMGGNGEYRHTVPVLFVEIAIFFFLFMVARPIYRVKNGSYTVCPASFLDVFFKIAIFQKKWFIMLKILKSIWMKKLTLLIHMTLMNYLISTIWI